MLWNIWKEPSTFGKTGPPFRFDYVRKLKGANILISMTQQGDPYENAIAERVNGILKTDFRLNRVFITFEEAQKAVEKVSTIITICGPI